MENKSNTTNFSPCEFTSDRDGKRDVVNFMAKDGGELERIEAKRNAVIFDYFEVWEDGVRKLRRFVSVECKDAHMKDELVKIARELLK